MTTDAAGVRWTTAAIGSAVVPLLAIAAFLNYADRGNLAIAAPLIKDELRLSTTQVRVLVSAFFL
jgi:hypothetical protein